MVVTLGQQYNTGEKPTVVMYTYIINRHAGTPDKNKTKKTFLVHDKTYFDNNIHDPYTIKTCSLEHKQCYNVVIGLKIRNFFMAFYLMGSPIMVLTLGQQYYIISGIIHHYTVYIYLH